MYPWPCADKSFFLSLKALYLNYLQFILSITFKIIYIFIEAKYEVYSEKAQFEQNSILCNTGKIFCMRIWA